MARAMGNNVTVISDKTAARAAKVCRGSRMVSKAQRPGLLSPVRPFNLTQKI